MNNEKINSKIKLSNNLSFIILIFVILKFRNIGRSTFRRSKCWPPPKKNQNGGCMKKTFYEKKLFFSNSRHLLLRCFWKKQKQ